MYQKPSIERFGSFRDLTQTGNIGLPDNNPFAGISGNGSNCFTTSIVFGPTTIQFTTCTDLVAS